MGARGFEERSSPAGATPATPVPNQPQQGMPLLTERNVAYAQGAVWVVSGVWPIVNLPTFEMVTGPKVDGWLVKTVGALITTVGVVLLSAARRDRVTPEIAALGAGAAAGLAAIDLVYVPKGRISPIYLADAVMEAGFIAAWALARKRARKGASSPRTSLN